MSVVSFRRYDYSYGKNGEVVKVAENNRGAITTVNYEYNEVAVLINECYVQGNNSYECKFTYDAAGNRFSKEITTKGDVSGFVTADIELGVTNYTYNKLNQFVTETYKEKTTEYTYDDAGNLVSIKGERNISHCCSN